MTLIIDAFFSWKKNFSDIWQAAVLKDMLRDSFLSRYNYVCKVIRYVIWLGFLKELKFSVFLDSCLKTSLNDEKVSCYASWEWSGSNESVVSSNALLAWHELTSRIFHSHFLEN